MLTFPLELHEGVVEVTNNAKIKKKIYIYIPNKDSLLVSIPAGEVLKVTTKSAGESFMYFSQADEDIDVKYAE